MSPEVRHGPSSGGVKQMSRISGNHQEVKIMKQYECDLCGYIYDEAAGDPDNGVAPGTKWEDVPADWVCPLCGAGKDEFTAK